MVVSDMNDRLSPNIAPLTTTPNMKASCIPVFSAIPTATGASATIVPTEVPTDKEIKQAAMNNDSDIRRTTIKDKLISLMKKDNIKKVKLSQYKMRSLRNFYKIFLGGDMHDIFRES